MKKVMKVLSVIFILFLLVACAESDDFGQEASEQDYYASTEESMIGEADTEHNQSTSTGERDLASVHLGESESFEGEFEYTFISFDVLVLESVEELADEATHIVRGAVLEQRTEWLNFVFPREVLEQELKDQGLTAEEIAYELRGMVFEMEPELITISRVRVLEVFQGDHNVGDIIEIMQSGGEYGNERWVVEDALEIEVGVELVLFLFSWEFAGFPYSLISHMQGAYHVPEEIEVEGVLVDIGDWEIELEGLSEFDPITLTIEDLIEISEENGLLD